MLKLAIICGGPGLERGISLNSARSVLDHLGGAAVEIVPFYLDHKKQPYKISKSQLYSNTPSDFDFKLATTAKALTEKQFITALQKIDLVFPVIHGEYGEDGGLQSFLEKHDIRFIGAPGEACKNSFDKFKANEFIRTQGFFAPQSLLLKIYDKTNKQKIHAFFKEHKITRAVVKPSSGGSSIGVYSVTTAAEAAEKADLLFSKRMDTRVVVEPFAQGREFTVVMLQNKFGLPVSLIPTEIEADYYNNQIFDYRKKYLPTRAVTYHCPPRFSDQLIRRIQIQAEQLFMLFGYNDFARFDGWVMDDGNIWFSDFNPISGMEQNSFLFQQASRVGLSHKGVLHSILESACRRYELPTSSYDQKVVDTKRKPVAVLCGGSNSERQVSLMSGTNVWLKLKNSKEYDPKLYLLSTKGSVWQVPYQLALNHTVEEIQANCANYQTEKNKLLFYEQDARERLGEFAPKDSEFTEPKEYTLDAFIKENKYIFIALHGGMGEDGELQAKLEKAHVLFNGSNAKVSQLCMDKWLTSKYINELGLPGVVAIKQVLHDVKNKISPVVLWTNVTEELQSKTVVVKPRGDGCSTGVAHLQNVKDLENYLKFLYEGASSIPPKTLTNQIELIKLPKEHVSDLIFEAYIETDTVRVVDNTLKHKKENNTFEITIGLLENKGVYHALNPSITIAEGEVLSLEEKFQGGTGVNITPPPVSLINQKVLTRAKKSIEHLAQKVGIQGYSRIDAFINGHSGALKIIEINSLPGLTPSTVLYHQALAEKPAVYPKELLEKIISSSSY